MNYAIQISKIIKDIDFLLLNIQPTIFQYLLEEAMKSPKAQKELNDVSLHNRQISSQLHEEIRLPVYKKMSYWNWFVWC